MERGEFRPDQEQIGQLKSQETEKRIDIGNLKFDHAEAALEMYRKQFDSDPKYLESIREIFYTFFEQEVNNTEVYRSEKFGAAFPYTRINVAELARALFEKHAKVAAPPKQIETGPRKQEYVFGSALTTFSGNEFTFVEEAMHQVMKALPRALDNLKNGQQPEETEIFTLGMPTNALGYISPEFAKGLEQNPSGQLGKLYSEFAESRMRIDTENKPQTIEFFGTSMGAGMAVKAGEELLANGFATQDPNHLENLPLLQIRAEVPVAISESRIKPIQIPVGDMIDAGFTIATKGYNRTVAPREKKFMNEVNDALAAKDIKPEMSKEQMKLKKFGIRSIVVGLGKGLTFNPELKITKVVGLKDLTIYTPGFNRRAKKHRVEHPSALGQNLVPEENPNVRTFGINMSHVRPFFRPNEFRRMKKAAEALRQIENPS